MVALKFPFLVVGGVRYPVVEEVGWEDEEAEHQYHGVAGVVAVQHTLLY